MHAKKTLFRILFLLVLVSITHALKAQESPNVIIIVTDDQGYGDLSCHGNPVINTPNMDKLHEESIRFTNFHVDPTCAPTRAALMSGKYSHRAGVWHTIAGGNHLRDTETTMADIFKASGYRTGAFGKWHMGSNYPYRPMDRGFDEWLGNGDGGTGTTDDWFDNDRVNDTYWHNGKREKREGYAPDVFFNAATDFIKESQKENEPFFVYLATYLPHHPHTVPDQAMIDKYESSISKYVAYFFAGIDRIDQNIGKLRKELDKLGLAENTILLFMSDNGGTAGVKLYNAGMRGKKTDPYEGGHRVPFFVHWPQGNLKHGSDVDEITAHFDVLPSLIDLCDLSPNKEIDFDGRSFKQQLHHPETKLSDRVLFVENQRTFTPKQWHETAGMMNNWRLVNNTELYDLSVDFAQENNVIDQHPEVAQQIREAYTGYWERVTPGDRDKPRFIVGTAADIEVFLTPSDWYLLKVPWNHAQVAKGSPEAGAWDITIAQNGTYRFEVRRWPREADATIQGIPTFNKNVDAYDLNGPVEKLIYGSMMKALPVSSIKLDINEYSETKNVSKKDQQITFDVQLEKGNTTVKGVMLDANNQLIAGAYYVYVRKIEQTQKISSN